MKELKNHCVAVTPPKRILTLETRWTGNEVSDQGVGTNRCEPGWPPREPNKFLVSQLAVKID
jgi:hypothetical protein